MPENIFKKDYDVVILTETFLTEPRNIAGYYDFHCLAGQHQKSHMEEYLASSSHGYVP
jgi:hypothetical protein